MSQHKYNKVTTDVVKKYLNNKKKIRNKQVNTMVSVQIQTLFNNKNNLKTYTMYGGCVHSRYNRNENRINSFIKLFESLNNLEEYFILNTTIFSLIYMSIFNI